MEISIKVIDIIKELSGKETINETDALRTDVGLDSLGMVMLLIQIEDGCSIVLDEVDMNPFELVTVQDVIKLAEKYCKVSEA